MEHTNISLVETHISESTSRIIEYADLVKTLQLSIAREINIASAHDSGSLEEALVSYDALDREHINAEIGARFDDALIRFMGVLAIGRRPIIIQAGTDEGINGYLPWEVALKDRITSDNSHDSLSGADIRVERIEPRKATPISIGMAVCDQLVITEAA